MLADFFESHRQMSSQHLEYVPTARVVLAKALDERDTGGFTIGVQGVTSDHEDYVKFGTAIGHLIGPTNHDAMSRTFYARFVVRATDAGDSYRRQAYRRFTLHTDGTFVDEATDWLLMMKFSELHARGGESRLLHLDDWESLKRFSEHPPGAYPFTYRSPASKKRRAVRCTANIFQDQRARVHRLYGVAIARRELIAECIQGPVVHLAWKVSNWVSKRWPSLLEWIWSPMLKR